jgi:type II secretory pathway pseudopilin PulG
VAISIAIVGSLLAIAIPAFVRSFRVTYHAEATSGLTRLSEHAIARAQRRPTEDAFPRSAPITPETPPRGTKAVDPPGTWAHPTWVALDFQATPDASPHAFSYGFDSTLGQAESRFTAHAHADLDGDGETSTFELHGKAADGTAVVEPRLYVEKELE